MSPCELQHSSSYMRSSADCVTQIHSPSTQPTNAERLETSSTTQAWHRLRTLPPITTRWYLMSSPQRRFPASLPHQAARSYHQPDRRRNQRFDSNGVLSNFSFTDGNGAEFYKSGSTLYITQTGTISSSTVLQGHPVSALRFQFHL